VILIEGIDFFLIGKSKCFYMSAAKLKFLFDLTKSDKGIDPVDIMFCKADGSYSDIVMNNGKIIKVCKNLKSLRTFLVEKKFYRCHHSYLINKNEITGFDIIGKKIILAGIYTIPISRRKLREISCKVKEFSKQKIIS
jgi:DNA-binding LytR/AlgR family response regulator